MILTWLGLWLSLGVLFWCLVDTIEMKKEIPYALIPDKLSLVEKRIFMVGFCGILWLPLVVKAAIEIVVGTAGTLLHLTLVVIRFLYLNICHWRKIRRKEITVKIRGKDQE